MKVSELIWVKRESKSDTEFIFTAETPLGKMAVVSKLIWSARSIMTGKNKCPSRRKIKMIIIDTNNLHSESLNNIKSKILGLIDIKYSPLEALKRNMHSFFEIIDEITTGENKATFNRRWDFHEYKNSKYHRSTWQQLKNRNTFVERYYDYVLYLEGLKLFV